MTINDPSGVVSTAQVYNRLNIEVYYSNDAGWCKKRRERIDDRVEIRLQKSVRFKLSIEGLTIIDKLYDKVMRSAPPTLGRSPLK